MSSLIQKAYGRGWAKFAVPTSPGSQIMCIIGAGSGTPPYPYDPAQNYRNNAVVSYSAVNYTSIQENNLGNQPDISPSWWIPIPAYSGSHTYSRDNVVSYGGHTWWSKQDGNTGNTPVSLSAWWTLWDYTEQTLFIGKYDTGGPIPGDDQNNGYNSTGSNLVSSPGGLANDVWFVETSTVGGGTHEPPTAGVQVVYMSPLASDQWVWIYELDCSVVCNSILNENAVDLVDNHFGTASTITGNDVGAVGQGYPGTSGLNGDFLATVVGLDSESISTGPPGWTEDTAQGSFAVYYQFFNLGDHPIPTFTLSGSVGYDYSTIGMSVAPSMPPTMGNIVIQKVTSPSGSPQSFIFSPSWGSGFVLTDGQSHDSGALSPGTYSVSEAPVINWTTATSSDPNAIVVTAGVTTTVTFTNTFHAPPPPPPSPCAAVDPNNNPIYGVFISDLSLFIEPASALYTSLVPHAALTFSETELQGRREIILDFNGSDGLWTRDLGTIFTWATKVRTVLRVWQPSIAPTDGEIYDRLQFHAIKSSLGMVGYAHARQMNIAHISTADLTLELEFDDWPTITLTIPNSGGVQMKTKVTLPPNKWKLIEVVISSTAPFKIFGGDLELTCGQWGRTNPYQVLRPVVT